MYRIIFNTIASLAYKYERKMIKIDFKLAKKGKTWFFLPVFARDFQLYKSPPHRTLCTHRCWHKNKRIILLCVRFNSSKPIGSCNRFNFFHFTGLVFSCITPIIHSRSFFRCKWVYNVISLPPPSQISRSPGRRRRIITPRVHYDILRSVGFSWNNNERVV